MYVSLRRIVLRNTNLVEKNKRCFHFCFMLNVQIPPNIIQIFRHLNQDDFRYPNDILLLLQVIILCNDYVNIFISIQKTRYFEIIYRIL